MGLRTHRGDGSIPNWCQWLKSTLVLKCEAPKGIGEAIGQGPCEVYVTSTSCAGSPLSIDEDSLLSGPSVGGFVYYV